MEKALLVIVDLCRGGACPRPEGRATTLACRASWPGQARVAPTWTIDDLQQEFAELVRSAGLKVVGHIICRRDKPAADYFVGYGKAQEIALERVQSGANVVIFNEELTATQQRNLEELIDVKVIDRTQLILDIFAQRAKSREGKLQVELAQMNYLLPRLSGKGVSLSRLGGGVGTRGPGEQKLEMDRRTIREKIAKLKDELKHLTDQREGLRTARKKYELPLVALVGYTNAGKSTLFNALTDSHVMVMDKLFATLDPTIRKFSLPNGQKVLFVDTVGFLHNLPHNLIEAFKATLEEISGADVLIHVLDITHPKAREHSDAVFEVLKQLNSHEKPFIVALNKADKVEPGSINEALSRDFPGSLLISALKKEGLEELISELTQKLPASLQHTHLKIPADRAVLISEIYKEGIVGSISSKGKYLYIKAQVPLALAGRLEKQGFTTD